MVSLASAAQERLGRDSALRTLKVEIASDDYKEVIGKLAYAIVELQDEVRELRAGIALLQDEAGTR